MVRCTNGKECYSATEVCVHGECVPICVDDNSCPNGFICDAYKKARLVIFNHLVMFSTFINYFNSTA